MNDEAMDWITGDNATNEAMAIEEGLALLRKHTGSLDAMGALNLRILRQVLAGYEQAEANLKRGGLL